MASFKIDESVFDKLAGILKKHELSEIEYKDGDSQIRISAQQLQGGTVMMHSVTSNASQALSQTQDAGSEKTYDSHVGAVKSPMVGTCYMAPEPDAKNFISVGDNVQQGQPILIIESMKVMNMIKSPRSGTVAYIAVSNGDPIEYDQLLVVIE